MKHRAVLLLGGNIGNTHLYFDVICQQLINVQISILKRSSLYSSPPWGFEAEQDFLNQALLVECEMDEYQLLEKTMEAEKYLGRDRKDEKGYTSRVIDIDILFFEEKILNERTLVLPHPRIHLRKFALLPLKEIIPEWIHPVSGKSIEVLIGECEDKSEVRRCG